MGVRGGGGGVAWGLDCSPKHAPTTQQHAKEELLGKPNNYCVLFIVLGYQKLLQSHIV